MPVSLCVCVRGGGLQRGSERSLVWSTPRFCWNDATVRPIVYWLLTKPPSSPQVTIPPAGNISAQQQYSVLINDNESSSWKFIIESASWYRVTDVCDSALSSSSLTAAAAAAAASAVATYQKDEQMIRHGDASSSASSDGDKIHHTATGSDHRNVPPLHQGITDQDRTAHSGGAKRQARSGGRDDRCCRVDHPRWQRWRTAAESTAGSRQQTAGQDGRRISARVVRKTDRRRRRILP